jgi:hypothetical protein
MNYSRDCAAAQTKVTTKNQYTVTSFSIFFCTCYMKVPYKCNEVIEETTNPDDGEIKIKAVAQLQSITNQLEQYYVQLPSVAKAGTMDTNTLFPSSSISAAIRRRTRIL